MSSASSIICQFYDHNRLKPTKDRRKLLEEKLQTSEGKFPVPLPQHSTARVPLLCHKLQFRFAKYVSPRYGSIMTPKIFFNFHHHDSLSVVPTRTTSHLVSSLHRNFGTRSLNRENSEVAYYKQMSHSFYSMSW